ncbi:SDR family NAD(P)-dependent oxidoreductase [Piscinibacter sp.]|uniref:SDR family NAD(P)-dependent oxidoreductase n=1 Tax=Piscinibacter sp. TaxID=1903157 RepID=UPI002F40C8BD
MTPPIRFDNRVAIVTGAGGGLGRGYALDLAARGAAVVVNDLGGSFDGKGSSTSMADAVVAEIVAAGGRAVASYDSVSTSAGGQAIVKTALDAYGRVDVLISNAGSLRNAPIDELPDDTLDAMIDVHLKGGFNVSRPAFRQMKKQGYGRVVFASSAAGMLGNDQQAAYGAAKAGLVGLMNVLSLEGAAHGIKANALLPTAMSRMSAAMDPKLMEAAGALYAAIGDKLGNSADPAFVTPLVVYLCSEACDSSHSIYSATLGRYARVALHMGAGWVGPRAAPPRAEDVAAHWAEVCEKRGAEEVHSLLGEFELVARRLKAA